MQWHKVTSESNIRCMNIALQIRENRKSLHKVSKIWISVPMQRWSKVPLVALRRSEFPKANATISR